MSKGDENSNMHNSDFGQWRPPRAMGLARALQKAGYGTRKQMEQLITNRKVEVNGESTDDPLFPVDPDSVITIDGRALNVLERCYFAINKPARVVCSAQDGNGRDLLDEYFPRNVSGLVAAGRMDGKTTGLMLLSNDAAWNTCFTECTHMEQEYRIQFEGELSALELELIEGGIQLPVGGVFKPQSIAVVEVLNGCTVLNMVVIGKIRLVRQLLKSLDHKVVYLRRQRLGIIRMGNLPVGMSRPLMGSEIKFIKNCLLPAGESNHSDEDN